MIKAFLVAIVLFCTVPTFACEICGCGNNNFQIGILPSFRKGFIGLRYSSSQFSSHLKTDASEYSKDHYQTMELWGGYNFKRFQVMAFVPYIKSNKVSDDGISTSKGLGDLLVLVNYKLFTISALNKDETGSVRNEVYIGGGVKLPTGVNRVDTKDPDFNIGDFNSQAGTGSTDYLANVTHNISWNKSGIVTNAAYRINTANQQDYRFGNRIYVNSAYYYSATLGSVKFKPGVGVNYQSNKINHFDGAAVADSNGYNLNATGVVNFLYGNVGINAMTFIPVAQDMYDGQTKLKSRLLVGVTYSF